MGMGVLFGLTVPEEIQSITAKAWRSLKAAWKSGNRLVTSLLTQEAEINNRKCGHNRKPQSIPFSGTLPPVTLCLLEVSIMLASSTAS